MPKAEFNSVYLPAGEQEGWLRFESAEGKHLYRDISHGEWCLHDRFNPEDDEDPAAYVQALNGLLPVGEQQWTCFDEDRKDLLLMVLLLVTAADVETAVDRLKEARERQLAEMKATKEATG